jgi:hypothetical protein
VTAPWWAAFGPTETSVDCGDRQHRMRWADGTLQAVDHTDAEGESVLAALGGSTTPCIDLVRAWGTHAEDLRVLAIGPRSGKDTLRITPGLLDELKSSGTLFGGPLGRAGRVALARRRIASFRSPSGGGFAGHARQPRRPQHHNLVRLRSGWLGLSVHEDEEPADTGMLKLLALGPAFQFRLSGAVAHAWSADGQHAAECATVRPMLIAALAGRLAPAVAGWLRIEADRVEVSLHDGPGSGTVESSGSAAARQIRARLPVSWLARVWAPGLAVVDGHLVLSVQQASWPTARVLGLKAPDADPVELRVRNSARGWAISA